MYAAFFFLIAAAGLVLAFFPVRVYQRVVKPKTLMVFLRVVGTCLLLIGALGLYVLLSGALELPLTK